MEVYGETEFLIAVHCAKKSEKSRLLMLIRNKLVLVISWRSDIRAKSKAVRQSFNLGQTELRLKSLRLPLMDGNFC